MRKHLLDYEQVIRQRLERVLEDVLYQAQQEMILIINTSGTGWVGKGAQAFAEGRVDTGDMRAAVDYTVKATPSGVSGAVGWGLNGNLAEPYFLEQEEGFVNPWTGKYVPPMMALWTADNYAKQNLRPALRKVL